MDCHNEMTTVEGVSKVRLSLPEVSVRSWKKQSSNYETSSHPFLIVTQRTYHVRHVTLHLRWHHRLLNRIRRLGRGYLRREHCRHSMLLESLCVRNLLRWSLLEICTRRLKALREELLICLTCNLQESCISLVITVSIDAARFSANIHTPYNTSRRTQLSTKVQAARAI